MSREARSGNLKSLLLLAMMADLAFTVYGLERGYAEMNPIASSMTPGTMAMGKLLLVTAYMGVVYLLEPKYEWAIRKSLWIGSVATWIAVMFNFIQIILD